jgi:DNA-binding GntR family transcriptional regulator
MDVSMASVATYPVLTREDIAMPRRMTWREIADDLIDRIRRGEYEPGQKIPSYRETAVLYGVSITTAAKAIARLTDRGWIETDPGRGNVVREDRPREP